MSRVHQDSSSIQLSSEPLCRVLPLVVEQSPHFSSLETNFFKEGDELAAQMEDESSELTCIVQIRRQSKTRWPIAGVVLGAAGVAGLILFWGTHRKTVPRLSDAVVVAAVQPATVEVPMAAQTKVVAEIPAEIPTEVPTKYPAPAPAAARSIPSQPQATVGVAAAFGAVATPAADDALDACHKAFDQHRTKDVLSVCAQAFESTPPSAKVAVILAKTEFDRGRPRQALDWAKKAIAIDADHADAYVFLGGAEQAAGRSAAAKAAYKRYLQLAPQGRYAPDLRAVLASL
jgi:tetratricopeptide (TPR) repeat protein